MKKAIWIWVGRISTVLVLIVALIQVIDWFASKQAKITADYFVTDYYLPQTPFEKYSLNKVTSTTDILLDSILIKNPKYDRDKLFLPIFSFFTNLFSDTFINTSYSESQQIDINIKNNSRKLVNEVIIDFGINGFCKVIKKNESIYYNDIVSSIKVNDLLPKNTIKVIMWTRESSLKRADEIIISSNDASVRLKKFIPATGFIGNIYTFRSIVKQFIYFLAIGLIAFYLSNLYLNHDTSKKK